MTQTTLWAKRIIGEVAKKEGCSVQSVMAEMESAILQAYQEIYGSGDSGKIAIWERIAKKGNIPTPAEMILFLADELKMKTDLTET